MKSNSKRNFIKISLCVLFFLVLSGCNRQSPAAQSVEAYLKALVSDDVNDVTMFTCKEWEEEAIIEYDSFQLVSPKLQDVQCSEISQSDGYATVQCTGQILATYNNEITTISLENRLFNVKNEKGDWFVCGYQ
jgi:outer membrane lipoprotein-sorting protein